MGPCGPHRAVCVSCVGPCHAGQGLSHGGPHGYQASVGQRWLPRQSLHRQRLVRMLRLSSSKPRRKGMYWGSRAQGSPWQVVARQLWKKPKREEFVHKPSGKLIYRDPIFKTIGLSGHRTYNYRAIGKSTHMLSGKFDYREKSYRGKLSYRAIGKNYPIGKTKLSGH